MRAVSLRAFTVATLVLVTSSAGSAIGQTPQTLPSPLGLADVIRAAGERRDEIEAARARLRAGEARPAIVSALDDPMISPSLDHLPFSLDGADISVTIEQRIPLSGIRRNRRASALADVDRLRAEAQRTTLDVAMQAATAFLMLQERRRTQALVTEQIALARDLVTAANARYASGTAPQSDVLRAELELARFEALARALVSEVRGAEAVLLFLRLGSEFMPPLDERSLLVMPTTFAGISIEEARRVLVAQDRIIMGFPEVQSVHGKVGRAETATDPAQLDMIESVVALRSRKEWSARHTPRWYSPVAPE